MRPRIAIRVDRFAGDLWTDDPWEADALAALLHGNYTVVIQDGACRYTYQADDSDVRSLRFRYLRRLWIRLTRGF